MKKIILVAFVIFLGSNLKAQISAGLKLGTNFSSVQTSGGGVSISTSNRTAFNFGGYARIDLPSSLKLQPEFLYQGMGGTIDGTTFKNDYLTVPILLQYAVTKNFLLEAGPQIGLLVSSKVEGENIKDAFKSSDVQMLVGASVGLTGKIGVGVRYGMSLSNISTESYSDVKADVKNKAFSIMVSYKLF
jgi:hypothetical protein